MSGTIGAWPPRSPTEAQPANDHRPAEVIEEEADWSVLVRRAKESAGNGSDRPPERGPPRPTPSESARLPQRAAADGEISHNAWAEAVRRVKDRR